MADIDYYKVLGVKRDASQDDIKRAYRRLAKQYHPDRNPDDSSAEKKFKEVQQAYDVLSNPEKREQYDQFGTVGVGHWTTDNHGQKVYEWGGGTRINIDDLEDLFSVFQGAGRSASPFEEVFRHRGGPRRAPRQQPQQGSDIAQNISLTFDQAVNGATVSITRRPRSGRSPTTGSVKIPPGVETGQKIRLRGEGQPGRNGGPPGDLIIHCTVEPHAYFRRVGQDIHLDVPVGIDEATLGTRLEVPTLTGPVTVTVPAGTKSGAKLRLRGRGGAKPGSAERGDQFVIIQIVPPSNVNDELRKALESLRTDGDNPRSASPWA